MSIVIFLILLTSSMSNGDAAENSNKEEIVYRPLETIPETPVFRKKRQMLGPKEQDPNDPKYEAMAADLVYQHLHIKKQDTRKIIVTKVTTYSVEGLMTTIKFQVVFQNGEILRCSSEIWEQYWRNLKDVSYQCPGSNYNKPWGITKLSMPLVQNNPIVDHTKYRRLAKEPVVNYFKKLPEHITIQYSAIHFTTDALIQTRVGQRSILYINADVKVSPSRDFKCTAVFEIPRVAPLSVECFEKRFGAGIEEWADPSQEKYLRLAEKSLLKNHQLRIDLGSYAADIIVIFVVEQGVAGTRYTIDFLVGRHYKCRSDIWENLTEDVILDVNCHELSAGQSRGTGRNRWTRI